MWSIDELQDIWYLVTRLHAGQQYGGQLEGEQIEYINHIGSVTFEILAAIQQTLGMNADLAIKCAMLHDSIEDTPFSYDQVKELFGEGVAQGVMALTKNENLPSKQDKMQDSLLRIKEQAKEVWAVKMADRICNLYAPPYYWTKEKKLAYLEEARLIHRELHLGNAYLGERLSEKIKRYEKFC